MWRYTNFGIGVLLFTVVPTCENAVPNTDRGQVAALSTGGAAADGSVLSASLAFVQIPSLGHHVLMSAANALRGAADTLLAALDAGSCGSGSSMSGLELSATVVTGPAALAGAVGGGVPPALRTAGAAFAGSQHVIKLLVSIGVSEMSSSHNWQLQLPAWPTMFIQSSARNCARLTRVSFQHVVLLTSTINCVPAISRCRMPAWTPCPRGCRRRTSPSTTAAAWQQRCRRCWPRTGSCRA